MSDAIENELLKKTPHEIKRRLHEIISLKDETYFSFNWLGFAFVLTSDANREIDNKNLEMSVFWAKLVFEIRKVMSEIHTDYFQNELSEMMLRVRLINAFGHKSNDPIFDAEIIYRWFFERLEMNISEAVEQSKIFFENLRNGKREDIDVETARKIRNIKGRVHVISLLNENPAMKINSELTEWLKVETLLI